jgi:hypothetical protein
MARAIDIIKQQITTEFLSDPAVRAAYGIESSTPNDAFDTIFSKISIENITFYDVAFAIYIFERIFDTEKELLTRYCESLRPHTKQWYINQLRSFQLGDLINRETGQYNVIDEAKQIIKYCSLRLRSGEFYFLVASDSNGVPQKIGDSEILTSIWNYCERVFDAGVHFKIFSNNADIYKCRLLINYDPLVLDSEGRRLDGTNDTPVIDAIRGYFKSFPFDSEFSNMALTDAIQQVDGVRIVQLLWSNAQPIIDGAPSIDITSTYVANAGYMTFTENGSQIIYEI